MNRWVLTDEIRERINPLLKEWFELVENATLEQIDKVNNGFEIDLSDKGINPYQLESLLEEFGYETKSSDRNGWELDFWIDMRRKDGKCFDSGCEKIVIGGCGMTFELRIYIPDEY